MWNFLDKISCCRCLLVQYPLVQKLSLGSRPLKAWFQDIDPIEKPHHKPPNVLLDQKNVLSLPLESGALAAQSQDFVFSRFLKYYMEDWSRYFESAFELLKPGGYLEVQETEDRWRSDNGRIISNNWQWLQEVGEAEGNSKIDRDCGKNAADRMEKKKLALLMSRSRQLCCPGENGWPDEGAARLLNGGLPGAHKPVKCSVVLSLTLAVLIPIMLPMRSV